MFDFWYGLSSAARAIMGLALIGIALAIYFASGGTMFAIGLGAIGLIFLLFSGAGSSKDGYNF